MRGVVQSLHGKVVLITGASRGIGRALAVALSRQGAQLALAARDRAALAALAEELGTAPLIVPTDVADADACRRAVDETVARFGRLDVLVNNAALGMQGIVADMSLVDLEYVFRVNVFGVVALTQAAIPHLRRQGGGQIVMISSILGKRAVPQTGGYAATKFALHALSDALRIEEAPYGIAVTVVCPGSTETDFRKNERQAGTVLLTERPRVNAMSAAAVADVIIDGIVHRRREVVVSPFGKLFSALEAVAPRLVDRVLTRTYHKKRR